ncbi:cupin domain-containing protein [Streptomycetaceae bacterium NBC_01309]
MTKPSIGTATSCVPVALFGSVTHLDDSGTVRSLPPYTADASEDGWTFSMVRAVNGRDFREHFWEMHPTSDKFVAVTSGSVRLHLRAQDGQPPRTFVLGPGTASTVPAGRWHLFEVAEPSSVLTLARPTGALVEPVAFDLATF